MGRGWCEQIHSGEDDSGHSAGIEKCMNLSYTEGERQGRRVKNDFSLRLASLGGKWCYLLRGGHSGKDAEAGA